MLGDLSPIADTIMNNTAQAGTETPGMLMPEPVRSATLTEALDDVANEHDDSDPDASLNDADDEVPTPSNQSNISLDPASSQADPLFVGDDIIDPLKVKAKPVRKAKVYTCFQCPKV